IMLADQPFISAEMINQLIHTYRRREEEGQKLDYVTASYQAMSLPPVLFSSRLTPLLLTLQGDEGARRLVRKNGSLIGEAIEFENANLFLDVDTPADYQSLRSQVKTP
ncbi:MAG: NTP transferase domain-containing protein, partial [Tumebacillaceae bacterium]